MFLKLVYLLSVCKSQCMFVFTEDVKTSGYCAPSILITFINMMLFKTDPNTRPECDDTIYAGQMGLQKVSVLKPWKGFIEN